MMPGYRTVRAAHILQLWCLLRPIITPQLRAIGVRAVCGGRFFGRVGIGSKNVCKSGRRDKFVTVLSSGFLLVDMELSGGSLPCSMHSLPTPQKDPDRYTEESEESENANDDTGNGTPAQRGRTSISILWLLW